MGNLSSSIKNNNVTFEISIRQLGWYGIACGLIGAITMLAGIWFGAH